MRFGCAQLGLTGTPAERYLAGRGITITSYRIRFASAHAAPDQMDRCGSCRRWLRRYTQHACILAVGRIFP